MSNVDEVKQRLDIVQVVSEAVPNLKKAGRAFRAQCPFHSEKDPSFYVFPDTQTWRCFGACATGGDVFAFVMKKEGIEFGEALRLLADKAGVQLVSDPRRERAASEDNLLRQINSEAAEYFHGLLLKSRRAAAAREYLEKRGVSGAAIKDFQLGYSLDGWDGLKTHLNDKNYTNEKILAAGLLIENDGKLYDRFRNRIMFPIRGSDGKVTGFGARALDSSPAKYLNSPQTRIFDKSGSLYGIDRARVSIRKEDTVVVVEGYMDVIAAHQYGFTNVVASLGTALTERQIGIIKKLTRNLVLALDADAAGQMATLRGIDVATRAFDHKVAPLPTASGLVSYESILDAEIKVMVMPEGKDPDDVIKADPENWRQLVSGAIPVVEFTFKSAVAGLDLSTVSGKTQLLQRLLPVVSGLSSPVSKAHYLQALSRLSGVEEKELAQEIKRLKGQSKQYGRPEKPSESDKTRPSSRDGFGEYIIVLLMRNPSLRERTAEIDAAWFSSSESREVFLAWRECMDAKELRERLDPSLQELLDQMVRRDYPPMNEEELACAFNDCVNNMKRMHLQELKRGEALRLADAQAEGSTEELQRIQEMATQVNDQLLGLFKKANSRQSGV